MISPYITRFLANLQCNGQKQHICSPLYVCDDFIIFCDDMPKLSITFRVVGHNIPLTISVDTIMQPLPGAREARVNKAKCLRDISVPFTLHRFERFFTYSFGPRPTTAERSLVWQHREGYNCCDKHVRNRTAKYPDGIEYIEQSVYWYRFWITDLHMGPRNVHTSI